MGLLSAQITGRPKIYISLKPDISKLLPEKILTNCWTMRIGLIARSIIHNYNFKIFSWRILLQTQKTISGQLPLVINRDNYRDKIVIIHYSTPENYLVITIQESPAKSKFFRAGTGERAL